MGVSHDTLYNHYETNFYLSKMHEFSISEIDNMLPFEREVYLAFVKKFVEEEKKQKEAEKKAKRAAEAAAEAAAQEAEAEK